MTLIRGPFTIKWGTDTLDDIESIEFNSDVKSEEYETNNGKVFEIDKSHKVSVILTLLATDIASLSIIFPQYFVDTGELLSNGHTVIGVDGAIDFDLLSCDEEYTYHDLQIISCANPNNILNVTNARAKLEDIEIDGKVQKIKVKFISEVSANESSIQIFAEGAVS